MSGMRRLLLVAALIVCSLYAYCNRMHLRLADPRTYQLSAPAFAGVGDGGELLLVDGGSTVVVRVDARGRVDLILHRGVFRAAAEAVSDTQGNLYILDLVRTGSRQLLTERILKFSPSGRFVEEVFRYEHTGYDNRPRIAHLSCSYDTLCFVELTEDSFLVHTSDAAGTAAVHQVGYPGALSLIWSFAAGEDGLVGLDKQGHVFRVGKQDVDIIYCAADDHPSSIPGDLTVAADGSVLLTDRGLRQISRLENGAQVPVYTGAEAFADRIIYNRLDYGSGLVAVSEYGLLLLSESGEEAWVEELPVAPRLVARRVLVWCALAGAAVLMVRIVWLGARALLRHPGRVLKTGVAVLSGALALSTLFSLIVMLDVGDRLAQEKLLRLTTSAQLTAKLVPTDAFVAVRGVSDYMGGDYRLVQDSIRGIFQRDSDLQEDMYCILYRVDDGVITVVYATDENTSLYPYDWAYPGSEEERILQTGTGLEEVGLQFSEGEFMLTLQPIFDAQGEVVGIVEMGADMAELRRENRAVILELYLNTISISVVAVLVVTEVMFFLEDRTAHRTQAQSAFLPVGVARMGVFLVFFLSNMCTAFLPLYTISLLPDSGATGGHYEQLVALPLSIDVLSGALAALFGHRLMGRWGTDHTARAGAVLFSAGMLLKCIPRYGMLLFGSVVFGLGWGLLLLQCNLNMAAQPSQEAKNAGFAGYTASMLSGVNCGVVVGSFLLNWFSFGTVLRISALLALLVPLFVLRCFRGLSLYSRGHGHTHTGALRFLRTPRVLLFFCALVFPMLACGYFLNYLFPIAGYELGISEVHIGYAFLLYNLLIVCFGTGLTAGLTRRLGKTGTLLVWGAVYTGAFLLFARFKSVPALLAALALLGLSDGFGLPVYTSYYTDLPAVNAFGQDRAIGLLGVVENVAQTAGPFLFSLVLAPNRWSLELVAVCLALLVALFAAGSLPGRRADRRRVKKVGQLQ